MRNEFRAVLLLIVMSWQTLSLATPFQAYGQTEQIAHSIIHSLEVSHHHHSDQSLHLNVDSECSSHHHHVNQGVQPPALEPWFVWVPADPSSSAPVLLLAIDFTSFTPDGLLRPPRT